MDYTRFSDETLLQLIARAQSEALSELYDRYSRLVFSLALNAVGDQATAEEITQEVFIQVWSNARSYRAERAKVSTWLTSITRYRSIDVWRRRRARPEIQPDAWSQVERLPDHEQPDQIVEQSLQRQQVRDALAQLPTEQRQALALAYFRGYSHREIAQSLELPLGTVKTRIRLGMQKLRAVLSAELVQKQ